MSIRNDPDVLYCSVDDVARYFEQYDTFDDTTDPTRTEVEKHIGKWSAKFDRKTGRSFRENQVINETHDHERLYYWLSGHPITLMKKDIVTPLDPDEGDKLEVWTGNKWEDWLQKDTRTEGRDGDYWVDSAVGILYIFERAILRPHPKFRVSYRYGNSDGYVPADVRDAIAARTAADLIRSDFYGITVPGNNNDGGADPGQSADQWQEEYQDTIRDWKKPQAIWD